MARIRSIKPGFCTSESIAALPIEMRLHFALLWTYADDQGRGRDNPKLIKAELWPLDDEVTPELIEGWQDHLGRMGRITQYENDGKALFEVTNWEEHQHPKHYKDSEFPGPETEGSEPRRYSITREDQLGDIEAPNRAPLDPKPAHGVVGVEVVGGEGRGSYGPGAISAPGRVPSLRPRDELFEVIAEVCGMTLDKLTKNSRGELNQATKQLREVGADPPEVRQKAAEYRLRMPTMEFTPSALVKHWPRLGTPKVTLPKSAAGLARVASRQEQRDEAS